MSALPSATLPAEPWTARTSWQATCLALLQCLALALVGEWLVWTLSGLREPGDGVIWSFLAGQAVLVGSGGWLWYRLALLRSRILRIDAIGIQYVQGVLPWKKTRMTVAWADFADAEAIDGGWRRALGAGQIRIRCRAANAQDVWMRDLADAGAVKLRLNALAKGLG